MSIRRDPIYISNITWRCLRLLAKAEAAPEEGRIATADEIADRILIESISKQFPQLIKHQAEVVKLEKEVISNLFKKEEP